MSSLWIIGCGYLGEAIADAFAVNSWEVLKVSRSEAEDMVVADVSSRTSLAALGRRYGRPDVIVHCASSGRGGAESYERVFYQGAKNLRLEFPGSSLIFTSSSSVYPQTDGELVDEGSAANPERETGRILRRAEDEVIAAGGIVMRLSGIYGEGRSAILKKWLTGAAKIEEDGRRILNQIHRRDAAQGYVAVVDSGITGEIFNVSESHPKSQLETYQWLAQYYGSSLPESVPRDLNRKRGWTHKAVSNSKLQGLGWRPKYASFTDAVADLEPTLDFS